MQHLTQNTTDGFNGTRTEVVIVGGGTAGITVAAALVKKKIFDSILIIDPSQVHYYQPLWTLVGGGVFPKEVTMRWESDLIPHGVNWLEDAVKEFQPEQHQLTTEGGKRIQYQYLIVCPGMELFWDRIPGLIDAMGHDGVCSNYSFEYVESTWNEIKTFKGGRAIFTFPNTPIKCGGAPQKIMYLAEDYFRKMGVRGNTEVLFVSAGAAIFAVKKYAESLNKILVKRDIHTLFKHNLIAIEGGKRLATFENVETKETKTLHYDLIHVTPPMGAPSFVRKSPLANKEGFVEVDKFTLQHVRYPDIFGLGDASSLPTSRTGAAIRKQSPVVIANLIAHHRHQALTARYDGYTSCPLVTGYGKLILAEFDYDGNPVETFPFDQSKERYSMYLLKKHILPKLYWEGMLKGRA